MKNVIGACAVAVSALMANAADAATYSFSYQFDDFASVTGTMDGTVSAGVLAVDAVSALISSTGGVLGVVSYAFDTALGGFLISGDSDSDPGTLALDGSFFDLAVLSLPESNACVDGLGFCLIADFASASVPGISAGYILDTSKFSISEIAAVPLPATLPLLAGAIALLGGRFGRKKKAATHV